MNATNFKKVVKANRLLSCNQNHKITSTLAYGNLTSFWVDRGKLFGTFSYKNSMATNPGLRLEMDRQVSVPFALVDFVLNHFESKGIS